MQKIVAALVSAVLMATIAGSATAKSRKHPRRDDDGLAAYAAKYPSATRRQLRNARAYDRGEYYERDSNALPTGSRAWWEQKERESGGSFRF